MKRHRAWRELSSAQRLAILVSSAVEVVLAAAAWADLARRPTDAVNGRKRWWAVAIAVNFVGPLAYFRWGRGGPAPRRHPHGRHAPTATGTTAQTGTTA
ncbi:PLDc N-terminal domain-containing protein [Actinosynnema sp. NPDC051121]|nr:hypothetical protein [Saccharothrix sp.]